MAAWMPLMLVLQLGVLLLAVVLAVDAIRAHSWRLPTFAIGFSIVVNVAWLAANQAMGHDGPGLFHVLLWSVDYWGFFLGFLTPAFSTGWPEWISYVPVILGALIQGFIYAVIGSTVLQQKAGQ